MEKRSYRSQINLAHFAVRGEAGRRRAADDSAGFCLLSSGRTEAPKNCRDEAVAAFERLPTSGWPYRRKRSWLITKLFTKFENFSRPTECERSRSTTARAIGRSKPFRLARERRQIGEGARDNLSLRSTPRKLLPAWAPGGTCTTIRVHPTHCPNVLAKSHSRGGSIRDIGTIQRCCLHGLRVSPLSEKEKRKNRNCCPSLSTCRKGGARSSSTGQACSPGGISSLRRTNSTTQGAANTVLIAGYIWIEPPTR
jgi:hypothetical protein